MTRACTNCPALGARRVKCVCAPAPLLCDACTDTHRCPAYATRTLADWHREHPREADLTAQVIAALNHLPGVLVWQAKKRGQGKATQEGHVLDVIGYAAPHAVFLALETKRTHPDSCRCESCKGQRAWAARLGAAGGIVLLGVRDVQRAVDGVRTALARRAA